MPVVASGLALISADGSALDCGALAVGAFDDAMGVGCATGSGKEQALSAKVPERRHPISSGLVPRRPAPFLRFLPGSLDVLEPVVSIMVSPIGLRAMTNRRGQEYARREAVNRG
ncbi:hypothetical protein StoSoilA2_03720 [Arthrobacter sp. StoSoilA2]|nr:hypothetical protein StoSoilA2_03720 [Arthrobacter sp. StoSoilA2]